MTKCELRCGGISCDTTGGPTDVANENLTFRSGQFTHRIDQIAIVALRGGRVVEDGSPEAGGVIVSQFCGAR